MGRGPDAGAVPAGYVSPAALAGEPAGTEVLLALSGGPDSASLLDMAASGGEKLLLCHVNHGIRGAEADRDEEFCRGLAAKDGLPIEIFRADVPAEAVRTGEGLEEAARRVRYDCFGRLMAERGIGILATAHNADDNAETVLLRLVRGASAGGACGIPAVRELPGGGKVVRPLLGVTRERIMAYCSARGLGYVIDSTNSDIRYTRNRIRARVMPELKEINPDVAAAVARFAESVRADSRWLDSEAGAFFGEHGDALDADMLRDLPPPVAARVLTLAARAAGAAPEKRHIDVLAAAVAGGVPAAVTLPGSVRAAVCSDGSVTFRRDPRTKKKRPQSGCAGAKEEKKGGD